MSGHISHRGVIKEISKEEIFVEIVAGAACASCSAKSVCNPHGSQKKIIQVKNNFQNIYHIGEEVNVLMRKSLGMKAVVISFVIPSIILLSSLAIFTHLKIEEAVSGLLVLLILTCYYLLLRLFYRRWKREFDFTIEKI